jgi:hypothetical protein
MNRLALRRVSDQLRVVSASCVVLAALSVTACDRVPLPSQAIARGGASGTDTLSSPRSDTMSVPRDTALAIPSVDTSAVVGENETMSARPAELPRLSVDTWYPDGGRGVRVAATADLQAAIDSAVPGDVLLLAPGAVYTGNFTLPDKGASQEWIVIRTDVADTELGAEGSRMTPTRASAARLAAIVSNNAASPLTTAVGAHHYRFTGVEVTALAAVGDINALVRFGDNTTAQSSEATTAHHLVIDRSYVHGTPTLELRRCVMLNSATSAVIDSWLADCHSNVSDSQAIVGWNGPGPYLIQNNHLEAGHEVVMFGGGGTTIPDLSPSDVTIRGNHFTRPLAWKGVWGVKNLLETKNVRRLLVEGNVFENNWTDAQAGFAFIMKSENQNGDSPWTQSTDITFRYNRIRNTGNVWNLAANPSGAPAVPAARIAITDNVVEDVNTGVFTGDGHSLQLLGGLADIVYAHNTVVSASGGGAAAVVLGSLPTIERLALHSNVFVHGTYGVKGNGTAEGRPSLALFAPGSLYARNLMVGGGKAADYPGGNFFARSMTDVGFVDLTGGNYRLSASSYRGRGFDGRDVGADIERVDTETRQAVVAP